MLTGILAPISGRVSVLGLDLVVKREVRALLGEIAKRDGTTVFITSHNVGDIERICKRAIIIHHGGVVVDESMKELRHRSLSRKYIGVKYASPVNLDLGDLVPAKRTETAGASWRTSPWRTRPSRTSSRGYKARRGRNRDPARGSRRASGRPTGGASWARASPTA